MTKKNLIKALRPLVEPLVSKVLEQAAADIIGQVSARFEAIVGVKRTTPTRASAKSSTRKPVTAKRKQAKRTSPKQPPSKSSIREVAEIRVEREPTRKWPDGQSAPNVAAAPKKRATMKCGNCGELGFRSDGCGKTHNVGGVSPIAARVSTPEPTTLRREADATPRGATIPSAPARFGSNESPASAARRAAILARTEAGRSAMGAR